MLLQEAREDDAAAEAHDGGGERDVDEGHAAEGHGKDDEGKDNHEAGHLKADEAAFRFAGQAQEGARDERQADATAGHQPKIHCCAPSALAASDTSARRNWWRSMRLCVVSMPRTMALGDMVAYITASALRPASTGSRRLVLDRKSTRL